MSTPHQKLLGRLETTRHALIAVGGAQFNADGSGFFITEFGMDMLPTFSGRDALICSAAGSIVATVSNVQSVAASAALPRHYTFTHHEEVPFANSVSHESNGAKRRDTKLRLVARQDSNRLKTSRMSVKGRFSGKAQAAEGNAGSISASRLSTR
jgi:hypothetical protein